MRDFVAGIVAIALLFLALSLATALRSYRRRRQRALDSERALGRRVIAELPAGADFVIVSEDDRRFYYGERSIDKDLIAAVRLTLNGVALATSASPRHPRTRADVDGRTEVAAELDRAGSMARDHWDVTVETIAGAVTIHCGAIRERVSQELARTVFDAIARTLERPDA
jgi:hypothetical protein